MHFTFSFNFQISDKTNEEITVGVQLTIEGSNAFLNWTAEMILLVPQSFENSTSLTDLTKITQRLAALTAARLPQREQTAHRQKCREQLSVICGDCLLKGP